MGRNHVLITGLPGIGKTTLIKKVAEALSGRGHKLNGFYTEEVRESGRRIGFDVVMLCEGHRREPLARTEEKAAVKRGPRVGQYVVQTKAFEEMASKSMQIDEGQDFLIIDEIGKMELFSSQFKNNVVQLFEGSPVTMICTVPSKGNALVESLKSRTDVELFTLNHGNRDQMLPKLLDTLQA